MLLSAGINSQTRESIMPNGTVKWFNNSKGYGFIVEEGESEDLFAHFSSIQMEGYKTLKAGQKVSFEKQPNGKGIHAINISSLEVAQTDSAVQTPQESATLSTVNETTAANTPEAANDIAVSA
jgi:cold shock protein